MRKNLSLSVLLLAITFVIVNCTKEGPEGPAGPAGPQGNAGLTGPQGPAGTANVIYSAWATISSIVAITGPITDSTFADYGLCKRWIRNAPGITAAILDNGVILSYWKVGAIIYSTLPYQFPVGAQTYYLGALPAVGKIIYFTSIFGTNTGWTPNLGAELRHIIIPGTVLGGRTRDPRTMTYQEVCQAYGIPE
jgi:hypothetical protein